MRRISLRITTFYIHVQLHTNIKLLFPMTFMFSLSKHRVHFQAFIPIENCIKFLFPAFNASFAKFKPIQLRKFSLNFCTKYACACAFFLHIFHADFMGCFFLYLIYCRFHFIFSALSQKWRPKLFVLELRQRFYSHLLTIQSKKLPNHWRRPNNEARTFYSPPLRKRPQKIEEAILVINISAGYSM